MHSAGAAPVPPSFLISLSPNEKITVRGRIRGQDSAVRAVAWARSPALDDLVRVLLTFSVLIPFLSAFLFFCSRPLT